MRRTLARKSIESSSKQGALKFAEKLAEIPEIPLDRNSESERVLLETRRAIARLRETLILAAREISRTGKVTFRRNVLISPRFSTW